MKVHKFILSAFLILLSISCKSAASFSIDGETKIRYVEMYGSICCPRDYKYEIRLLDYINAFEIQHNLKIESTFKLPLGKEGEAAYLLSLENLSIEMQQKFISNRLKMLKPNDLSVKNYLIKPISINKVLTMWENKSIHNLIKI